MMKFTTRRSDAGRSMEDILEKIKMSQTSHDGLNSEVKELKKAQI